nr:hypothetical protein [Tanacetum cinerariifolium]
METDLTIRLQRESKYSCFSGNIEIYVYENVVRGAYLVGCQSTHFYRLALRTSAALWKCPLEAFHPSCCLWTRSWPRVNIKEYFEFTIPRVKFFKLFSAIMSAITDGRYVLTQEALDAFVIRFISQRKAAKVSHFEILCHVYEIVPTVRLFLCFYVNSKKSRWMSFSKRSDNVVLCYTKPLDSLKNWNNHFFWVDDFACPASFLWHTAKHVIKDPAPVTADFNAQDYATLVTHPSPFQKFLEVVMCLVGVSRHYTLDEETYPRFMHKNGEGGCLLLYLRYEKVIVYENCMEQLEKFQDDRMKIVEDKFDKLYTDFVKMALHLEEHLYSHLLTTICGRSVEAIMEIHRLEDPVTEKLGLNELQSNVNQLMVPIHISLDKVVIGATALSLALDASSSSALKGVEGTFGTMPATTTTTALSITLGLTSIVNPISIDDYEFVDADDQAIVGWDATSFPNADDAKLHIPE